MSRKYEQTLEIAAPAAAVWKAIAEAEGIQSWFVPNARVTPGKGGSIWVSWGPGMEGESRIEVWEPGRQFRYAFHHPAGEREPNVVDFTIESHDGSHTTLRLVNSGFGSDASFDDEFEATSHAWPQFLRLLQHGLEHPHQRSRNIGIYRPLDIPLDRARRRVNAGLPIAGKPIHFDPIGYAAWELDDMNHSPLAVFAENCGGATGLTVMCVLYDPTPDQESKASAMVESLPGEFS